MYRYFTLRYAIYYASLLSAVLEILFADSLTKSGRVSIGAVWRAFRALASPKKSEISKNF